MYFECYIRRPEYRKMNSVSIGPGNEFGKCFYSLRLCWRGNLLSACSKNAILVGPHLYFLGRVTKACHSGVTELIIIINPAIIEFPNP